MDEKQINRNMLARAINARFEVIDRWYGGHVEKIDADILARICFVLECTPGDIIRYEQED
ncbi:MAG: helix-turn-helix transcriptional regulator [Lachnospiraceae bacterium]|nr:helix-turn-helix transcriptional regulator [Lachnospiraceae bacterium]